MMHFRRQLIISLSLSLLLFSSALVIMIKAAASFSESMTHFRRLEELKGNPRWLKSEMSELSDQKAILQARMDRFNKMQYPTLDLLSSFARQNRLTLNDIDCEEMQDQNTEMSKQCRLTFSGNIIHTLDALNLIESNFMVDIESIIVRAGDNDSTQVNMILSLRIPE